MLEIWSQPSGYNFGTFNERNMINIPLPTSTVPADVTFRVITGSLPKGLRIEGNRIIGTPFEVPRTTEYRFVVRASNSIDLSDRTFVMTVEGADEPKWLTAPGLLPVGANDAYYIIDSSFIDFQLSAVDTDTAAGQKLNFFIASGEGELPPGLILQPNGRITGFVQPLLEIPRERVDGDYDMQLYDSYGYDFGYRPSNGYDSFVYDLVTYDFFVEDLNPRKLNRNYEFIATITDGDTVTKRRFRIYVVGDDFFRADNVIMKAGEGTYTADATYVRAPVFTTPNYLGLRRANNYMTFKIDIFEGFYNELGPVVYSITAGNAKINGLVQKEKITDNKLGFNFIRFTKSSGIPEVGWKINFNQEFKGADNTTYTVIDVEELGADFYRVSLDKNLTYDIPNGTVIYLGPESRIPPGMQFDSVTGELFGIVPYQPAVTETYTFTIRALRFGNYNNQDNTIEVSASRRMFTVDILGEVESVINWNTLGDLGTIDVGYPSTLFVNATTTYKNSTLLYTLEEGSLPPGLSLNLDGEIVGKVNQLREQNTYRSYWKPVVSYKKKDLVKIDNKKSIIGLVRRRNIATAVTKNPHGFKTNDIIKISTDQLDYNYYSGVKVTVDKIKINYVVSVTGTGPYFVKLAIPNQKLEPLVPKYTLIKGLSAQINNFDAREVTVTSTSGNGVGARFLISKGENGTFSYAGLVNNSLNPIIVVDPGTGYLPGDTITISGNQLNGIEGVNDLTFTLVNGLDYQYKITGNSNGLYNGEFYAVSSSTKEKIPLGSPLEIVSATSSGKIITITTNGNHNLVNGDLVEIKNIDPSNYNYYKGIYEVNVINQTNFTYKVNNVPSILPVVPFNTGIAQKIEYKDTITLMYQNNPGTFGSGLISVQTGRFTYDAQTQISALNYFHYTNALTSRSMIAVEGTATGEPLYYRAKANHISDLTFSTDNWERYTFPIADGTVTTIDKSITLFDAGETEFDRVYDFTIKARDALGYSAISRKFSVRVNIPGNTYYSNIRARPFMKQSQRDYFKEFINDNTIFDPKYIYRLGDTNFGVQKALETLIYAGIETRQAVEYISAMGVNHKPKRFKLGSIKKAVAKEPGTNNIVYEVVYVELLDPLEKGKTHLPFRIAGNPSNVNVTVDNNNEFYQGPFNIDSQNWNRPIPFYASVDRTDIIAGDSGTGDKFPSSISIWRKRLRQIETARRERNYLPLWMRSIQPDTYTELDWVPAVVLCYCKPGTADEIILNIKFSNFDFKLLDYTIDRYIIDSVEGYYEDKYLVFRNDRTTIT